MPKQAQTTIPVLTEIIERSYPELSASETELLIAELQTRLASGTFELTERLLRSTMAEFEARLYEQVSARLRRELPELIDCILRDELDRGDADPS